MFKVLFVLLLSTNCLAALDPLCSNGKSENKCLCRRFTNRETSLPSSMAECSGIEIKKFPDISQFPDDVNVLDLSLNNIAILDPEEANVSSNILRKLVLSHNKINYVSTIFFQNLPELRLLDLSYNNITTIEDGNIFLKQKKLVYLDLSFNNIKELPGAIFDPLISLELLSLSYNPLGELLMGSKDVLSKTLGVSSKISHLSLNNVGLNDLHPDYFKPYENLKDLALADNNFDIIPMVPYTVEYLDFSGNNLSFVSAKYLNYHSLKEIHLSRMPSLVSIHHYAFYNLQSLEKLVITDCPNVNEFTELAFGLASKVTDMHPKTLILARNGLTSLNSTYKAMFRAMNKIDLRNNPWDCSCSVLWLKEFDMELFKSSEIRCATPRNLKNRKVMDLTHLDLQQCFPEIYGKTSHRVMIVILMATVILLMGFIFYLVRYPKTWLNPKHIGISPSSPYSPAPVDDRY